MREYEDTRKTIYLKLELPTKMSKKENKKKEERKIKGEKILNLLSEFHQLQRNLCFVYFPFYKLKDNSTSHDREGKKYSRRRKSS